MLTFSFPQKITECAQHFDSISLREHLLISLNNPQLLRQNLFDENHKFKVDKIKERDSHQTSNNEIDVKHVSTNALYAIQSIHI